MKCPRDQAPLQLREGENAPLECSHCGGAFIQNDQLYEQVHARFHIIHAFQQLSCPVCHSQMQPMHFDHGNIELDICSQCRGIWFDGSEQQLLHDSLQRLGRRKSSHAVRASSLANAGDARDASSAEIREQSKKSSDPKKTYQQYQDVTKVRGESSSAEFLLQVFFDLPIKRNLPAFRLPVITYLLIGLCSVVYLLAMLRTGQGYFDSWVFYTENPFDRALLLSMFAHADWLHLALNLWFLFAVGENVEDLLGRVKFLLFYLTCGVAATLAFVIFSPGEAVVGASGAISGVMGAYLVLFHRTYFAIRMFYLWEVEVPCWVLFLGYFGIDALLLQARDGTAHSAHLGGFVAGSVIMLFYKFRRLH